MDQSQQSDADFLWQDALTLLESEGLPAANVAMLKSCDPVSFDGETQIGRAHV